MKSLNEAEAEISEILKNLEVETGSVVRALSVEDVEVTNMHDDRRQLARRVVIELERLPGTRWST